MGISKSSQGNFNYPDYRPLCVTVPHSLVVAEVHMWHRTAVPVLPQLATSPCLPPLLPSSLHSATGKQMNSFSQHYF